MKNPIRIGLIIVVIIGILYGIWYYNEREEIPISFDLRIRGADTNDPPYMKYRKDAQGNYFGAPLGVKFEDSTPKAISKSEYKKAYLSGLKGSTYDVYDAVYS